VDEDVRICDEPGCSEPAAAQWSVDCDGTAEECERGRAVALQTVDRAERSRVEQVAALDELEAEVLARVTEGGPVATADERARAAELVAEAQRQELAAAKAASEAAGRATDHTHPRFGCVEHGRR
jgi:hypothetical protein